MSFSKIYKSILSLSVCVLIVSCSKQINQDKHTFDVDILGQMSQTKTTLNGLSLSWASGDALGVMVDGIQGNTQFSKTGEISFKGSFEITGKSSSAVDYYAYYPYVSTASGTTITTTLPNSQNAPFDGKYDVMVANVLSLPYNEASMPPIPFAFANHMNAIVKITISNSNAEYATEKVSKVVLQSTGSTMAGAYSFDISQGASCAPVFSGTKYDNVTVKYSTQPTLTVGEDIVLYAIIKSGTYSNFKLTIYTTSYSGGRTAKSDVTFDRGKVTTLPAIDFGTLMTGAVATIDDLGSEEYSGSDFWK